MSTIQKRKVLLLLALVLAVICVAAAEMVSYRVCRDGHEITPLMLSDGSEAYDLNACEFKDGVMTVTGPDPHFTVSSFGQNFSRIRMVFREPLKQDTNLQLFYVSADGSLSEKNSTVRTIAAGKKQESIDIPEDVYASLRFDFEQDVAFEGIYAGEGGMAFLPYRFQPVRAAVIFCVVFTPLCIYILYKPKKGNELKEKDAGEDGGTTNLICLLFVFLTVLFFQPMVYILINQQFLQIRFGDIWWIQLLLCAAATLIAVLLVHLLPEKTGGITSAGFLGLGIAYLVQTLLLNGNRIIPMDTNWPIKVLNVFIWLGIVTATISVEIHYSGKSGKKTAGIRRAAAWTLIVMQAMNFMILATSADLSVNNRAEAVTLKNETLLDREKEVIDISAENGLPYLMKDLLRP